MKDLKLFFDPLRDIAVATNYGWFYRLLSTELGNNERLFVTFLNTF